ncbi:MAG: response regulator [Ardenticatenales bacterium]|nr:response regulator [Ardenticatenales bacterium]
MPKLILVVDDEDGIREVMATLLLAEGYAVATARHGVEALEKAQILSPQLMILDMTLPLMDGHAVLEVIQDQPQWTDMGLLIMTASPVAYQKVVARLGIAHCLAKPFDLDDLLTRIYRLIGLP